MALWIPVTFVYTIIFLTYGEPFHIFQMFSKMLDLRKTEELSIWENLVSSVCKFVIAGKHSQWVSSFVGWGQRKFNFNFEFYFPWIPIGDFAFVIVTIFTLKLLQSEYCLLNVTRQIVADQELPQSLGIILFLMVPQNEETN